MLTIRNIDESIKSKLRIMAAEQGLSMEEQVRRIIRKAVFPEGKKGLGSRIQQRFSKLGGVELELPKRSLPRDIIKF